MIKTKQYEVRMPKLQINGESFLLIKNCYSGKHFENRVLMLIFTWIQQYTQDLNISLKAGLFRWHQNVKCHNNSLLMSVKLNVKALDINL